MALRGGSISKWPKKYIESVSFSSTDDLSVFAADRDDVSLLPINKIIANKSKSLLADIEMVSFCSLLSEWLKFTNQKLHMGQQPAAWVSSQPTCHAPTEICAVRNTRVHTYLRNMWSQHIYALCVRPRYFLTFLALATVFWLLLLLIRATRSLSLTLSSHLALSRFSGHHYSSPKKQK